MDANLLEALDREGQETKKKPALSDMLVYGKVRCVINRPDILGNGIRDGEGYYAILDTFALKCLAKDYFKTPTEGYDVNSIYFTKGSMLIYIDSVDWVGKVVKVFGKSKSRGATIRRQNTKSNTSGISAFVFDVPIKEDGKMIFPIMPNVLVEAGVKDPDAKGTILEDTMAIIASNKGELSYSETLEGIVPYTGLENYIELEVKKEVQAADEVHPAVVINDGRVDISKIDMHLVFHLDGQEQSPYYANFKDDIAESAEKRDEFRKVALKEVEALYEEHKLEDFLFIKSNFMSNVASDCSRKIGKYATVMPYIETVIENCADNILSSDEFRNKYTDGQTASFKVAVEKMKSMVRMDGRVFSGRTGDKDIDSVPMLRDDIAFTVNVVGTCTGIGFETLSQNMIYFCKYLGVDKKLWLFMLLRCPYYLGLLGTGMGVVDCDILYYTFSTMLNDEKMVEENNKYRSYLVMLDTLSACSQGNFKRGQSSSRSVNTFVLTEEYKRADASYSAQALKNLSTYGFIAKEEIKTLLSLIVGRSICMGSADTERLVKADWFSQDDFNALENAGIINTLTSYCGLERDIEREFLIYEVFEKMGKLDTGITDDTIATVINKFEADRGFKLEGLQREGIKLCKKRAGVLSGCAGSGKTTTSDCMTEVLKTLGKDVKIIYCTPTGKACRRLAEVVHSTVKTIHSQFNVRVGGGSYLASGYTKSKPAETNSIYILDEMAMCNTELMYHIAKKISDNDMIYFLGDVKQLPPIGGGCPFKVLMTILPCVELGVSKRAAEGSLVNYNTSLINFMSDGAMQELMYDDSTFIAKDCDDQSIVSVTRKLFMDLVEGNVNGIKYNEDDIQVISGYQTEKRLSSTARLNAPIQEYLRSNDRVLYYRMSYSNGGENIPYYQNDRVIYVKKNSYGICRYILQNGEFYQVPTFGCVNGEMGKLIGVIPTSDARITKFTGKAEAGSGFYSDVSEEELKDILQRYEDRKDDLRKDDSFNQKGYYFILIKIYDTDLRKDVVALLRARGHIGMSGELVLSGGDLDNLELAYALTCHKMQGSQSKVVVAVFESTGSPDFMNRNMINTIITRSQGVVCCVGSVLGNSSMLSRGRRRVSNTKCKDILSLMEGDDKWIYEID